MIFITRLVRILKTSCFSITRHDDLLEFCVEQMVNVCRQHACQCYTAFASGSNTCVTSSYFTARRLGIIFTLSSLFSSIFWQEKDNYGFLKYVFPQWSINLAILLALEIFFFFATHNEFVCHMFRKWRKIPRSGICYKDSRLIFIKSSLLCWKTFSVLVIEILGMKWEGIKGQIICYFLEWRHWKRDKR